MSFEIENTGNKAGNYNKINIGKQVNAKEVSGDESIFEQQNTPVSFKGDEVHTDKEKKETLLYEKVKVQPWGTGEDDCLSRIVQKHVEGIKLYSKEYHQFIEETCKLNNIKDPNIIWGEVQLPELKRNEDGTLKKDENGKLLFFSEDELKAIKE